MNFLILKTPLYRRIISGLSIYLFIITSRYYCNAFNIDTEYPVVFHGQPNSYFGYTVALLQNTKGNWVIVGAPKSNSTQFPTLVEPGEIFKCHFQTEKCSRIQLDDSANTYEYISKERRYTEEKNHAWLGVSLDTTQIKEGRIVACAHLWSNVFYPKIHLVNGVCYTIDEEFDELTMEKLIPLISKSDQITIHNDYKFAYAQGGTAAHFIKDSDSLLLGAPGIYDWRGSSVFMSRAESGIISKRSTLKNYAVTVVPDPLQDLDYVAYFGYALTSGKFVENKPVQYAIGAPRQSYRGKMYIVEIRDNQFEKIVDRTGEQMGEYFGAAICAVNLNGDTLDDLIVGAPLHSKYSDEGKIYVFINKGNALFQMLNVDFMGSNVPGARFGSSIAVLGDVNMDGYQDVAIGAPYENDRGAVYIYHGNRETGLKSTFQQKIMASSPTTRGFGISVARGMDIDDNNYPDLVVGAYISSEVIVFRTRPLVYLSGSVIPDRSQINMEVKDCGQVSCFKLKTCLNYGGKYVPPSLNVRYFLQVDTLKGNESDAARVFLKTETKLVSSLQKDVTLTRDNSSCSVYEVHAPNFPKDYMTPIEVYLSYEMIPTTPSQPGFCSTCPLLDQSEPNQKVAKVRFMKQCGDDEKCDTDLKINGWIRDFMNPEDVLVIGSQNKLVLHAEVFNAAEPAYATRMLVDLPPWMNVDQKPPTCDFTVKNLHQLLCVIANPLQTNATAILDLNLNLEKIPVKDGAISINVTAVTDSNEVNLQDNKLSLELPVKVESDIYVTGSTLQEQAFYDHDSKGKINVNTTASFSHAYELFNGGPSPVTQMIIRIRYPVKARENDKQLIQITALDTKDGQRGAVFGHCNATIAGLPAKPTAAGPEVAVMFGEDDTLLRKRRQSQQQDATEIEWTENNDTSDEAVVQKEAFILNCSTAICETISCIVGPFTKDASARLVISFVINIYNLSSIMGKKDTASVFTEAQVLLDTQTRNIQPEGHKSDYVKISTEVKPGGPPPPKELASWIIPVSVIGGLLLLVLLTTALVKMGFFRRKKKEEMERLMQSGQPSEQQNSLIDS